MSPRARRRNTGPGRGIICRIFIRGHEASHFGKQGMTTSGRDASNIPALREQVREAYWKQRDPINSDRMLWRAQTFRHIMHLLPGQRILEIGCGDGAFTRELVRVTRGECPMTAITFRADAQRPLGFPAGVEFLACPSLDGSLAGRHFDFIVAHDMLDRRNAVLFLQQVFEFLVPSGRVLFFESNPWNVFRRLRLGIGRLFARHDPRLLLSRPDMYELLSDLGFVRITGVFNDFVYSPLTAMGIWLARNLSVVLENMPGVRTLAGCVLLTAQKPPLPASYPRGRLAIDDVYRKAVSVVVPCHNEEMNVGPLVQRLTELFDPYISEIVLVNDNSTDRTGAVIDQLASQDPRVKPIHRTPPNGVGRAIADGLRATTGDYVLSLDCDFQHLLPEIRDLFDGLVEGYDAAIGARFSRHSVLLNYPFMKIVANRAFHMLARVVLFGGFRDVTNNLKLMRRQVVQDLCLLEPGFAVNAETGLQPILMNYRIKEVPVSWIGRGVDMGVSSFRVLRVGGGYWRVLYRLWLWRFLKTGPYRALRHQQPRDAGLTGRRN